MSKEELDKIKIMYPEISVGQAYDLTGKIFEKWKVLYRTHNSKRGTSWVCQCSCKQGTIRPVDAKSLLNGSSKSCGCLRIEIINDLNDKKIHQRDEQGKIIAKRCYRCERWLPISEYHHSSSQKDGYAGECKECTYSSTTGRYNIYKKNAKKRNIIFDITKEQFDNITSQPCFYCGEYSKQSTEGEVYTGIDRIDSQGEYSINNIVPCCAVCNKMKMELSKNDFLAQIEKISKHQRSKHE